MAAYSCWSILVFVLLFYNVHCWIPKLVNGRPKGGMLGAPKVNPDTKLPPAQWFEYQRLDHFDRTNNLHWKQRYFVNDTFYGPGGPIFLMIGGEGPANPVWMVDGPAWIEYVQMYGAIAVMLEHRYYGESIYYEDLSYENLRYLSSRQALEDIANFIDWFRLTYQKHDLTNSKLITFGGSYSGSLSAWFRSKYPYKANAAVASSAPIFAKLDFSEYLQVTAESLDYWGLACNYKIKNATSTMYEWWGQPEKRPVLQDMFQLCDKIDHTIVLDLYGFFSNLAGNFMTVVQYNKDNRYFEGALGTQITIDTVCNIMMDDTRGPPIQRYADVNRLMLKTFSQTCLDFKYTKLIQEMKNTDWDSSVGDGARQWMYQTCTEFGWFQSADYYDQPFGDWFTFPANYSMLQCADIFDKDLFFQIYDNVDDTNRYYGGWNISTTRVVFPNGQLDPWHAMSVTKDISAEATAIYIYGTAHCADMYPDFYLDPPQLSEARDRIANLIDDWLRM